MQVTVEEKVYLTGQVAQNLREDPRTIRRWAAVFAAYLTCDRPNQVRRQFSEKDIRLLRRIQWMLRDEGMTTEQIGVLLDEERQAGICIELPEDEDVHEAQALYEFTAVHESEAETGPGDAVEIPDPPKAHRGPRIRGGIQHRALTVWRRRVETLQNEVEQLQSAYTDLHAQWKSLGAKYDRLQEILQSRESVLEKPFTPRISFATDESGEAIRVDPVGGELTNRLELANRTDPAPRIEPTNLSEPSTQELPPRGGVRRFKRRRHHGLLSWFVGVLS